VASLLLLTIGVLIVPLCGTKKEGSKSGRKKGKKKKKERGSTGTQRDSVRTPDSTRTRNDSTGTTRKDKKTVVRTIRQDSTGVHKDKYKASTGGAHNKHKDRKGGSNVTNKSKHSRCTNRTQASIGTNRHPNRKHSKVSKKRSTSPGGSETADGSYYYQLTKKNKVKSVSQYVM